MSKYKLLVFGNGGLWSLIKNNIDFNKAEIVAFVNSDIKQAGSFFENRPVITPSEIINYEYDFIILASGQRDIMMKQIIHLNIPDEKIISFKMNESEFFKSSEDEVNNKIARAGNYDSFYLFSTRTIEPFHLCNMNLIGRERRTCLRDRNIDYVRLSSLELIAEEIYSNNVPGSVAELGVYKGEFAKHINALFPDRKIYLFDTFEGFNDNDVVLDINNNFSVKTIQFSDTDINLVLNKMKYPENVIIKKGYFPETAIGLEDRFAFVSIDVDLYKPIYEGLNYFYPRLSIGGYIFVHDYNNFIFKGVKEAVKRFCYENRIPYVPISDNLGTVVLAK